MMYRIKFCTRKKVLNYIFSFKSDSYKKLYNVEDNYYYYFLYQFI